MVMSVLDRSHFEAVHRIARVSMHTKARAVYARLFSGLIEQSKASATTITTTTISSSTCNGLSSGCFGLPCARHLTRSVNMGCRWRRDRKKG